MKNLQIKIVKYSPGTSAIIGVQKETVALPNLKKDILYVDGTEEYLTIKGVKTDGSYWGGYLLFQQSDIITASDSFIQFIEYVSNNNIGGYTPYIKNYIDVITKYDAKEEPSVYGKFRANFRKSLLDFLNTDSSLFEVKITQSLQDTKQLDLLAKTWENTIASDAEFTDTYKQGKLPMFVNKPAILSSLISCATCGNLENGGADNPYNIVGSSYPGANIKVFESYEFYNGISMQDIDNKITAGIASAIDESCTRFVEKLQGEDYNEEVEACGKSIEEEIKKLNEELTQTEEDLNSQKQDLDDIKDEKSDKEQELQVVLKEIEDLNDQLKQAASTYADCLDAAGADPAAIEACNKAYEEAKAEIETTLAEAETARDKLEKEIQELNEQIALLNTEIAILQNKVAVLQNALEDLTRQIDTHNKCKDKVQVFCGEEAP